MSPIGRALSSLLGPGSGVGQGPLEIMLRQHDFNTPQVETPDGVVNFPAQTLVAFTAETFRHVDGGDDDVWDFAMAGAHLFVAGKDILFVRVPRLVG